MSRPHPTVDTPASDLAGIVLAGGLARRMGGGDKPLVSLSGRPMLARVLERLGPQVAAVAINANGDPERFAGFGVPVIADAIGGYVGPLAGVLAGLRWANEAVPGASALVTVAGDTPFFPRDLAARLAEAAGRAGGRPIVLAACGGDVHPVFGLWPLDLADPLEAFLRDGTERKILAFTDRHRRISARFRPYRAGPAEIDPFFNVNTPDDVVEGEAIAATLADSGAA